MRKEPSWLKWFTESRGTDQVQHARIYKQIRLTRQICLVLTDTDSFTLVTCSKRVNQACLVCTMSSIVPQKIADELPCKIYWLFCFVTLGSTLTNLPQVSICWMFRDALLLTTDIKSCSLSYCSLLVSLKGSVHSPLASYWVCTQHQRVSLSENIPSITPF